MNTTKLTPTQTAMLVRIRDDQEHVPGGFPSAGRAASAWSRTARALQRRGFAVLSFVGCGSGSVMITDSGRDWLAAHGRNVAPNCTAGETADRC